MCILSSNFSFVLVVNVSKTNAVAVSSVVLVGVSKSNAVSVSSVVVVHRDVHSSDHVNVHKCHLFNLSKN